MNAIVNDTSHFAVRRFHCSDQRSHTICLESLNVNGKLRCDRALLGAVEIPLVVLSKIGHFFTLHKHCATLDDLISHIRHKSGRMYGCLDIFHPRNGGASVRDAKKKLLCGIPIDFARLLNLLETLCTRVDVASQIHAGDACFFQSLFEDGWLAVGEIDVPIVLCCESCANLADHVHIRNRMVGSFADRVGYRHIDLCVHSSVAL